MATVTREQLLEAIDRHIAGLRRAYTTAGLSPAMREMGKIGIETMEWFRMIAAALAAPPAASPTDLVALVREWQAARKPTVLATPGEFLAETFQAAVRRMSAADEALAACRLDVAGAETPAAGLREELGGR